MNPSACLSTVIVPTLTEMNRDSPEARLILLAISIQESALTHLEQVGGPARSFWQEEPNGIKAVIQNQVVNRILFDYCQRHGISFDEPDIYAAVATEPGQPLACVVARCLLLADPHPLPAIGNEEAAWNCYEWNWRPGKPDRSRWTDSYQAAMAAIKESACPRSKT